MSMVTLIVAIEQFSHYNVTELQRQLMASYFVFILCHPSLLFFVLFIYFYFIFLGGRGVWVFFFFFSMAAYRLNYSHEMPTRPAGSLTAQKYPLESPAEFDGHGRVQDRVDGTAC